MPVIAPGNALPPSHEQPNAETDENKWPKGVHSQEPNIEIVEEEQDAEADQNHGADRNASREIWSRASPRAKHSRQSKGIGNGLVVLDRFRRLDRVDQLVKVKG